MKTIEAPETLKERLQAAAQAGMTLAVWADVQPEKVAVHDPDGTAHTFAKVNANANRIVRLMRQAGLTAGDAVALVSSNRVEFIEVLAACLRGGYRLTPINWHLTSDEIAYILNDCDARAVFCDASVTPSGLAAAQAPGLTLKVAFGGAVDGLLSYEAELARLDGADIPGPTLGNYMLYTSGTTGRPKGVYREKPATALEAVYRASGYDERSVQLCAGPAYHAAPLVYDIRGAMDAGATLIFIGKWDSEHVLRTIAERRITHMHLVPIMFQRLLALPAEVKAKYDVGHLKYVAHGAAPCPPEVKFAVIDWFGPVLSEYYGGSEGGAGFVIDSREWLSKPGSVGKRPAGLGCKILDEQGAECPASVPGTIYHQLPPGGGFTYYKDETKTAANRVGDYFTLGDIGYFDEDGYLYLTGRNAETIISGGVNIYPQEIDNELIKHEAVADSSTVGVPHDEWGEQVKAVIMLKPGFQPSDELAQEILAFARMNLPSFKVPRSVDFVTDLPRTEAGKILRNKVRAPHWEGRARQI